MTEPLRLYYWPAPYFGDALSRLMVEHVSGRAVVHAGPKQAEVFALGSLMHVISKHWTDRVRGEGPFWWGTGLLNPFYRKTFLENVRVRLLRGPISAAFLRLKRTEFGDPALHLIDVRLDPETVRRDIAASAHVFSASLHRFIVADADGVANIWTDPEAQGRLKYHYYAASIGRDMIAPVEIADVPKAARDARDRPFPYVKGIARCRESLHRHFPAELRAGANT